MAVSDDETAIDPQRPARGTGDLSPGTILNGIYRIEGRLGVGGMGEVYRAANINNDEQDAVKIIGRGRADQTQIEAMFRKEARVLSRIRSPAVAQLKLFARDADLNLLYFVTDFVSGESLLDRLKRRAAGVGESRALMMRLLTGLQAVHDAGAVHRDLSPDNIILPDGDPARATIIDFGIAKELDPARTTMIGDSFAGKLGYIAPEQLGFSGAQVGPWTDLYSLALVGIAFAAGRPLDMGATVGRAEEARRGVIDLSAVPEDLRPVFARLLTYDWRERPSSAGEVLAMLGAGAATVAPRVVQPPAPAVIAPAAPRPVSRTARPSPTVLIGLVALVILLTVGGLAVTWLRQRPAASAVHAVATPPTRLPSSAATVAPPIPATVAAGRSSTGAASPVGKCGPDMTIYFAPDRAAMPPGAAPLVAGAVDRVRMCDPIFVEVTGRALTTEPHPFDLAAQRATLIAGTLREAGIASIRLVKKVNVASPSAEAGADTYRQQAVGIHFIAP